MVLVLCPEKGQLRSVEWKSDCKICEQEETAHEHLRCGIYGIPCKIYRTSNISSNISLFKVIVLSWAEG